MPFKTMTSLRLKVVLAHNLSHPACGHWQVAPLLVSALLTFAHAQPTSSTGVPMVPRGTIEFVAVLIDVSPAGGFDRGTPSGFR